MIKDIIINKSITFTFIQNGKIKEIILLYKKKWIEMAENCQHRNKSGYHT